MSECKRFNPDKVFNRFKLVEFPTLFVGLSSAQLLNVEINLSKSAYFKTFYGGQLLKFEDAREVSAAHRAFEVEQVDEYTIKIIYHPKTECISRAKRDKQLHNRFIFDLRLIQVDEARCCNEERHAEIGRFYMCGEYEYCQISHRPVILDFGETVINNKNTTYVFMRNDSKKVAANVAFQQIGRFEVVPNKFTLHANSSIRLTVSITPASLKVSTTMMFKITNTKTSDDLLDSSNDENYIPYTINIKINISYNKTAKVNEIESLHKLYDQLPKYTYIDKQLKEYKERKAKAYTFLEATKRVRLKETVKEKFTTGIVRCYSDLAVIMKQTEVTNICKVLQAKASPYDLFDILFLPFYITFGKVGVSTYGKSELTISNETKFEISVRFLPDKSIVYTDKKLTGLLLKLAPLTKYIVSVCCFGFAKGYYEGTFKYTIDNKYTLKHLYSLQVDNPKLRIIDKSLKFGMVTTDSFITSVPIKIYNEFNEMVNFNWTDIHPDIPFEITPMIGSIPGQSCRICDVKYNCKPTKTKTHDVNFISNCFDTTVTPIELNIVTRKLAIKFLHSTVIFKEIPLNLETVETVKLENSSREIALFQVVEPLIPGLRMEPMTGIIRPKMVMSFNIIVKISCVLEFAFDICVKINNKEVVILPISGNVVEPRINIQPKNIYMPRIPCHLITYVPVTLQNISFLKTDVQVLDMSDDNMFDVYIPVGNEKQRIFEFSIEGGQSKTVFIKVCDIFRREYEMYMPFKINGLLGPPIDTAPCSSELQYYIGEFEKLYENNPRVKLKNVNKDISYCRIVGVITVPWISFSVDKFEFDYVHNGCNTIDFNMKNVSKYYLFVTIMTIKLFPNFSLELQSGDNRTNVTDTNIKFELAQGEEVEMSVKFHPKGLGKFIATATMYLDKLMTIPYSNLTFIGKRVTPAMIPSTYLIIFPPCHVGTDITRIITVDLEAECNLETFSCSSKDESHLLVSFIDYAVKEVNNMVHTIFTVELKVLSETPFTGSVKLFFYYKSERGCDVDVHFCVTYCPLTLHANSIAEEATNPYPYYPLSTQTELYDYQEKCCEFLEKWMFQQGFRRDLYPIIPDTFHATASAMTSQSGTKSMKGLNVSYMNFIKRIAGPLMKHVRKMSVQVVDESFKFVKEIHDTYKGIIHLLQSRGANVWAMQPKFLLSYDQFIIYESHVTSASNADIELTKTLLSNVVLYRRLNKQHWVDFILQSYKVFVMDSCFFECVCVSNQPRDIVKVLIDWYNEHITLQHNTLKGKTKPLKLITNLTTDLTDGVALASAIISHCPFLNDIFSIFCEIREETRNGDIVNNTCVIIEAMNHLRLYFPLSGEDLFEPNFLQMLFLSIHLYVVLPMFKPKDTIVLNPPLLRCSTRHVSITPSSQESLIFSYIILNNNRNSFVVEKGTSDNGKKMFLSVKFCANFVDEEKCWLLVHGYNKTRIFDTYIMFVLHGKISSLNPERKCKVTGLLYRPNKVDIFIASPFQVGAVFSIHVTDIEPNTPVRFNETDKPKFFLRRLSPVDKEIYLNGVPKEVGQDVQEQKVYLMLICLSTQVGNSWVWFKSDIGQFFVRVTTQPRWDLALETLHAKVETWPMDPCSCGEACECYRTTAVTVPHRNDLMIKALRCALIENASPVMMNIFDRLIESTTGKLILHMLLEEGGTTMSELQHILRSNTKYKISSKALIPRIDNVTFLQHTNALLTLPITIPNDEPVEKNSITFTSECGMDVRTYKIIFVESNEADNASA